MRTALVRTALLCAIALAALVIESGSRTNFGQPTVKLDKFYEGVNGSTEISRPAADLVIWQTDWPRLPGLTGRVYSYWAGVRIYEKTNTFYNSPVETLTIVLPGGKDVNYGRQKGGIVNWIRVWTGVNLETFTTEVGSPFYSPDAEAFQEATRVFDEFKAKHRIDKLVAEYIRIRNLVQE